MRAREELPSFRTQIWTRPSLRRQEGRSALVGRKEQSSNSPRDKLDASFTTSFAGTRLLPFVRIKQLSITLRSSSSISGNTTWASKLLRAAALALRSRMWVNAPVFDVVLPSRRLPGQPRPAAFDLHCRRRDNPLNNPQPSISPTPSPKRSSLLPFSLLLLLTSPTLVCVSSSFPSSSPRPSRFAASSSPSPPPHTSDTPLAGSPSPTF